MKIRKKHIILGAVLFVFCAFIFALNYSWGNSWETSFMLSFMTFVLIFLSFSLGWELHDFWNYRWEHVYAPMDPDLRIEEKQIQIPVYVRDNDDNENRAQGSKQNLGEEGNETLKVASLEARIYIPVKKDAFKDKKNGRGPSSAENLTSLIGDKKVIIYAHGFTDTIEKVRHLTLPLSLSGFVVISYNGRILGRAGKKYETALHGRHGRSPEIKYTEPIVDLGAVLSYTLTKLGVKKESIVLIGASLGSISAAYWGVKIPEIPKVILLSSIARYSEILPPSPVVFQGKWWLWVRYLVKGVPSFPSKELDDILSPYYHLKENGKMIKGPTVIKGTDYEEGSNSGAAGCRGKFFFIHSQNDKIVWVENLWKNLKAFGVSSECDNYFLLKRGGHNFTRYEPIVLAEILRILKKR